MPHSSNLHFELIYRRALRGVLVTCVACSEAGPGPSGAPSDPIEPGVFGASGAVGLAEASAAMGSPLAPITNLNPVLGAGGAGGSDSGAGGDDAAAGAAGAEASAAAKLLLSEYVEGSSSNKALEIVNRGAAFDLESCAIELYTNGAAQVSRSIALGPALLSSGEVWVLCHPSIASAALGACHQTSGSMSFNGNDAIVLVCDGEPRDSLGQVGVDPGAGWSGGGAKTNDATLVRRCSVREGDRNPLDGFDPSREWQAYPSDTFEHLGVAACAEDPPPGAAGTPNGAAGASHGMGGAAGECAG